jgi:hypothetical protein
LSQALAPWVNAKGGILFYPKFTPGYLMTPMHPIARSLWGCLSPGTQQYCVDYLKKKRGDCDVIVRIKEGLCNDQNRLMTQEECDADPLNQFVAATYQRVYQTPFVEVFVPSADRGRCPAALASTRP